MSEGRGGAAAAGGMAAVEALFERIPFLRRHLGPTCGQIADMLVQVGAGSLEELVRSAVPEDVYVGSPPDIGIPVGETEVLEMAKEIARMNRPNFSMIGLGYYGTETPKVILRKVLENPRWYTAYTPYQPEISQGRLEVLAIFQTMVAELTAMPMANASLLDEATAAAEAMTLLKRASGSASTRFLVDADTFPQTLAVLRTRAEPLGIELVADRPENFPGHADDAFGALVSYPSGSGGLADHSETVAELARRGVRSACVTDLLALALVRPPGEMDFDVVVGSSQRFGVPPEYGGPHAAFMAFREDLQRKIPGRIVGLSRDRTGRPAYRLALQTREQHIRRDKATSNICTSQVLLAIASALYAIYHGNQGIVRIARRVHHLASTLADGLAQSGIEIGHESYFDTLRIRSASAEEVVRRAADLGVNLHLADSRTVGVSLDEVCRPYHVEKVWEAFRCPHLDFGQIREHATCRIPEGLRRAGAPLSHPVFEAYHSEHEMLRFLMRLSVKDIALDRSMIPLGSCTMKLNATTAMEPVTWPEFANVHPFAPVDQCQGYQTLISDISRMLSKVTGFHSVSLQPNAGSQGEYAGLLVIRKYLRSTGNGHRNVCLIPESAHGTNPASAAMAGMRVVVVKIDREGDLDMDDFRRKLGEHGPNLAALMVTYPSTCGTYGGSIRAICEEVHQAGGQVYMDGANLNALIGIATPGEFGPDVCHMNLHKTFIIPHGGGGPGVGPIGVRKHLAPYLPNHPLVREAGPETGCGPVAAAPWGSAGILIVSWIYLKLLGGEGLRLCTEVAVLGANYVASRLDRAFPVLFRGRNGRVAHECVLDPRALKKGAGVTVEDIAKRLADYGYHAPTISWPVAGTMMVEPTESESQTELDHFCEVMAAIAKEADEVAAGTWSREDNPLVNAPHTQFEVVSDRWGHAYGREKAAYPLEWVRANKYWPPVSRIDQVLGDRNLQCSCPPPAAYGEGGG